MILTFILIFTGLIEIESPTELEKEYIHGNVFEIAFSVAGARVAGEDTDPEDVEREVGIWLGTKAKPCGKEIATKKCTKEHHPAPLSDRARRVALKISDPSTTLP